MKYSLVILFGLVAAIRPAPAEAQVQTATYHSYDQMTAVLKDLAAKHKDCMRLRSLAKTSGGREVWLAAFRKGAPEQARAFLFVGGTESAQVAGSELALRYCTRLATGYAKADSITQLLATTTIYVIPRANPDATEAFFQSPRSERTTNLTPADDDRDGAVDEDDVEDLDGDGIIRMMRVRDPRGEWLPSAADGRFMKKADPAKGERGEYLLYTEGVDNDKDEQWNEDPVGGVDFNRNFPFGYEFFGRGTGTYPLSERESRAVAEFVFSAPNIAAAFSFSSSDNLLVPWKAEPKKTGLDTQPRVMTSIADEDQPYFEYASKMFRETTGFADAPGPRKSPGGFTEWVYYHTGRWSFSVRPWWWPKGKTTRADSPGVETQARPRSSGGAQGELPDEEEYAARALKANDSIGIITSGWKRVSHPDFTDREVEVGGPLPSINWNPPADSLDVLAERYAGFFTSLAQLLPTVVVRNIKTEKLSDRLFRVTADIANTGRLPTCSAMGRRVEWPRNVHVSLGFAAGEQLQGGKQRQVLDPIRGNGYLTLTWLVVGRSGSVITLTADSPMAGRDIARITLQ